MSSRVLTPQEMYPAGASGVNVRYLTTGGGVRVRLAESGADSARIILLLHGWGCSLYSFRFLMQPLAEAGYRAVAIDFPGHGLSDKPISAMHYTLDGMTEHLLDILDAYGAKEFELVGHSMGGRIALEAAQRKPHRVSRLWLINPVGFGPMPHITAARPFARRAFVAALPAPLPSSVVRMPVAAVYGKVGTYTPRDVEEYRAPTQFRSFLAASANLLRNFDWSVSSTAVSDPDIRAKTKILFGELDRVVQVVRSNAHDRLASEGWSLRIVKDVAHVIHEETPDEVLRMIVSGSN